MSKHNILCTVCMKVLKGTDDIHSTSCGHIFHFDCMLESQSRSTCCPQCEHFNPTTHKMFLIFDESQDENVFNNWNDKFKIIELHKQMEDGNNNYLHLQEKYSASQDVVRKLEARLKKFDNCFSQRTLILSDMEDRIKTLEELNHFLTIDNQCKSEALALKTAEITELQKSLIEIEQTDPVSQVLSQQVEVLQRKLESQSIQLNNEVANNAQLSTDKMKLQKYIETNGQEEANDKDHLNQMHLLNSIEKRNTKVACGFNSLKSNENLPPKSWLGDDDNNFHEELNSFTDNCLLIKNFPKNNLMYPLKNVICLLTSINQEYNIVENEILNIYVKYGAGKSDKQLPKNVTLFVEFKNSEIKAKFLLNQYEICKVFPYLELAEIDNSEEDDETEDLLMYAKQKLSQKGFPIIYRQNDEIIAQKSLKDSKGVRIISKNQINKLAKSYLKKKPYLR